MYMTAEHVKNNDTAPVIPVLSQWLGSWRVSIERRAFSETDLREAYDDQAPIWSDKLARMKIGEAYEQALCSTLRHDLRSDLDTPLSVLDCGVGAGDLSASFANICERPFFIKAVDISPRMLDMAEHRLTARGVPAAFYLSNVLDLPFEDNSFDVVMAGHVLEHVEKPFIALAEMVRVLNPGGKIVLFVTRQSLYGLPIKLKWRIHTVTRSIMQNWLSAHGLINVTSQKMETGSMLSKLSLVTVGQKALTPTKGYSNE